MKGAPPFEKLSAKSEEAIPILRELIETHRLEYLGAEFHPSAPPPESAVAMEIEQEEYEPQPLVPGQPTATGEIPLPEPPPKLMRRPPARKPAGVKGKRRQRPRGGGRM
jgi:hypothetical protein